MEQTVLARDTPAPAAASTWPALPLAFRGERIDGAAALMAHIGAWQALARDALVPAPTNEPAWLLAALRHLARRGAAVSVALAWQDGDPGGPRLVGVLAFEARTAWPLAGVRIANDWQHLYAYLGTPLLHRDCAAQALAACLGVLDGAGARALLMRLVPTDVAMADAFAAALASSGRRHCLLDVQARAAFKISHSVEAYLQDNLSRKRRKEFKRLRSRLEEEGHLGIDRLAPGDDVKAWCAEFYALERSGWKGRERTAIACEAHWQGFFDEALERLADDGDLLFWRLSLDGRPVAMTFGMARGRQAWLSKIAYDESLGRFSPGALIIFDVMESLVAEGRVEMADSCAVPDHPMINHIWRDAIALADIAVSAPNTPAWLFRLLVGREQARRYLRGGAKRLYHAVKAYAKGGGK